MELLHSALLVKQIGSSLTLRKRIINMIVVLTICIRRKYAAELTDLRDPIVIAAYYNLGLFYVARGEMLSSRNYYLKVQAHLFNNPPSNADAKWRLKNNNVEGNEGLIVDTRQIGQWINLWLSSVSPST
jgi:hypothetical protein